MRWIQIPFCAALAASAVLLGMGAQKPDQPAKKTSLNLRFQKGEAYVFEVTTSQQVVAIPTSLPNSPDQTPKLDEGADRKDTRKNDESTARKTALPTDDPRVQGQTGESLDYRLDVIETSAGESTLSLRVTQNSPSVSSSPRPTTPEAQREPGSANIETQSSAGVDLGTYVVRVDSMGRILECRAAGDAGAAKRLESQVESAGSPAAKPLASSQGRRDVLKHLQMILGTGLHGQELVVGKSYDPLAALSSGVSPASQVDARASNGKAERESPAEAPKPPPAIGSTSRLGSEEPRLTLRYEGSGAWRPDDQELARFTVLATMIAGPSPSSARADQAGAAGKPPGGKDVAGTASLERREESVGEVAYRTSDGLLHRGNATCPLSIDKDSVASRDPAKRSSISIRRTDTKIRLPEVISK